MTESSLSVVGKLRLITLSDVHVLPLTINEEKRERERESLFLTSKDQQPQWDHVGSSSTRPTSDSAAPCPAVFKRRGPPADMPTPVAAGAGTQPPGSAEPVRPVKQRRATQQHAP